MEPSSRQLQIASEAAARLIGYYPTIAASNPEIYLTGLVQLFCDYPEHLIAEAIDPRNGLPSTCDFFPSIAKVKGFLEPRWQNMERQRVMLERFNTKKLPEPPHVVDPKVVEGFKKLKARLRANAGM